MRTRSECVVSEIPLKASGEQKSDLMDAESGYRLDELRLAEANQIKLNRPRFDDWDKID